MSINRNYYRKPDSFANHDIENAIFSTNLSANTTLANEVQEYCREQHITNPKRIFELQDTMRMLGYSITITAYFRAKNKEKPDSPA
ncbi:hypothetical protein ACLO87_09855 [Paenalcaligenes sp. Me52]|uniref:hypothetical protein n=1 Tax=Paenalcaligenes sp. Me52 TaxID=3392038 RepID=UPI003D2E20AF